MAKEKSVVVVQDPEKPVAAEVLAQAIVDVSKGAQALLNGKLKRRAVLLLIQDQVPARIGLETIGQVLDSAANLAKAYIK